MDGETDTRRQPISALASIAGVITLERLLKTTAAAAAVVTDSRRGQIELPLSPLSGPLMNISGPYLVITRARLKPALAFR